MNTAWEPTGRLSRSLLLMACLLPASPASAAISVAIIDFQDTWSTTKGLGQSLTDLGQSYTDITSQVQGGAAINLAGFDTFIVGSFCTYDLTIRSVLTNATTATTLSTFVNNGGTVIVLTQADQHVSQESWVQSPAQVGRGDSDFSLVYRVQADHQLFNSPDIIVDSQLQGWQYIGSSTWPTSWESFNLFQQVGVLAGNGSPTVTLASIVETGWGTGRALFLSLAVDKARNIGNAQAKAQAPRLMRNLLKYAEDVKAGAVPPIEIYEGGSSISWSGRVFVDANGNGTWEQGEAGVAGVGVSDTIDLVLTAADGTYTLPSVPAAAGLLYISIPSGYAKSGPWYRNITAASPASDFDFALTPADETQPFDFVQISDIHIGGSGTKELLTQGLAQVAALKTRPAFILATGDLTDAGGTLSQYDDYTSAVNASQVKVFSVFGNHDASSGTTANYRSYLGPDYYSFSYGDCHFLVLNSVYKPGAQQNWIAKDLQLLRGTKRLFMFQHFSPSASEHSEFASYAAEAVFSGHWHSQHTVRVGNTASYNTANFLFGGIDCSPAGFKVIHVAGEGITSRMRWIADGKRLHIVTPASTFLIAQEDLLIVANAYETSADVVSMTYQLRDAGTLVAEGSLVSEGDWTWTGVIPAAQVPRGGYELTVTATNDRAEVFTDTSEFVVIGLRPAPAPPDSDWPQFGGGPQRGGATPTVLEPPLGPVWRRHTGGTLDFASPVLKGQSLYLGVKDRGDFDHNGVLSLQAASGTQEWFTPTPAAVSHSVAVDDDRVYACSHGGILHALNRTTGQQVWTATLGSQAQRFQYAAPVLSAGQVFAGTFAWFGSFNAISGAESWHQNYGADWISSNACPAVSGTVAVVPANWQSSVNLKGVSTSNGATLWSYTVRGLHGSPVITSDKVVFTDYDGQIHCANLSNGQQVWTRDLGGGRSASTPAVAFGTVVAGGTGSIKGFRLSDGQQLWSYPLSASALKMAPYNNGFGALAGSPTIADHVAYVPCGDGRLYALMLETGQFLWSTDFGVPLLSAPCISGEMLYLSAFDGNVYALTSRKDFVIVPDFDGDLDVDQADFGHLQGCLTGPGVSFIAGCQDADLDGNNQVELQDLTIFLGCLSGPGQPADPACASPGFRAN